MKWQYFASVPLHDGPILTKDLVFDIASLIEHFTSFMTLQPGDLILTGTPEGLADVKPGDEVVTEIEHVGRLSNTIVEDWTR